MRDRVRVTWVAALAGHDTKDGGSRVIASVPQIEAAQVTLVRGGRVVLRGVSFTVAAGKVLAVEGANGAGKTSLLRLLAGFLAPAAGAIRFGDVEEAEERGRLVGWLGHHDAAKPQMTVAENLSFFSALHGGGDVATALDAVGLARLAGLPGQYLSAGQKKRLALARLLVGARPIWLMDEPLASLDMAGKAVASQLVARHCAEGGIAIVATHEALGLAAERLAL
jgi:heme exporter protein A